MSADQITNIREFRYQSDYQRWLDRAGERIQVINVSTTKRWSLMARFPVHADVYVLTYKIGKDDEDKIKREEQWENLVSILLVSALLGVPLILVYLYLYL